jgi:hypothetical protein
MLGLAREARVLLEKYEQEYAGKKWDKEELLIGLMTDLGDLGRIILTKEGLRESRGDVDKMLRHELVDCMRVK